ncbi:MAG: beta-L-arabinofuranosidase domain-containing protein [Gemmatimonadota bacterium]
MSYQPDRREFLATTAAMGAMLALPGASPESTAAPVRRVTFAARPFDLKAVRLRPGIFRDALDVNRRYLMSLDPDRLLHSFRTTAGLPSTAEPYYGWEAPNNELRGHFVGHYLSGCALMGAQLGDGEVRRRGDLIVDGLAACQRADGYLSAFPDELFQRLRDGKSVWAPFYTLHKIMAGLLDSYTLSGNARALEMVTKMAEWTRTWAEPLDAARMARVLNNEHGGMADTLYQLATATGNSAWSTLAQRFHHERILTPLAEQRDTLTKVHSNTTIPKILGAARHYNLTGEQRSRDIAEFFWKTVTQRRSYVTGGSSSGELWLGEPGNLTNTLSWDTEESCVTYNMLKLTRDIMAWNADAQAADYYERALFNGMLGTQHPRDGEKLYYLALASGFWRYFGTPDKGFWCCHGSGVESFSKFGDSIYFRSDDGLYVNQFIASELDWPERGLRIVQDTTFPHEATTRLRISAKHGVSMALRLRVPSWTTGATVKVNGLKVKNAVATPGQWLTLKRTWRDTDLVEFTTPMSLHTEALPGEPTQQAVMFGPLVLAGRLGAEGLTPDVLRAPPTPVRMSPDNPAKPIAVAPIRASGDVTNWVTPVAGKTLEFQTKGQSEPITLVPFNSIMDERFVVYWQVNPPGAG